MREISIDKLAELIMAGFDGRIEFNGMVDYTLNGERFYEARGRFLLSRVGKTNMPSQDTYLLETDERGSHNSVEFRPTNRNVLVEETEKLGKIITLTTDFPPEGILRIFPEKITF